MVNAVVVFTSISGGLLLVCWHMGFQIIAAPLLSLFSNNHHGTVSASEANAPQCDASHPSMCFWGIEKEISGNVDPGETQLIFCYAIVTAELTIGMLSNQLQQACDGWALFSFWEDPSNNIWKVFTEETMRVSIKTTMREMVIQGAWKWLDKHDVFNKFSWLVKFDPDAFVRPSTLRQGLNRYPKKFDKLVSTSNHLIDWEEKEDLEPGEDDSACSATEFLDGTAIDGYFIAIPTHLAVKMLQLANSGSKVCDTIASGHDEKGQEHVYLSPEICEALNFKAASPKQGCYENSGGFLPPHAAKSFQDWISTGVSDPRDPTSDLLMPESRRVTQRSLCLSHIAEERLEWDYNTRTIERESLDVVMEKVRLGTLLEFQQTLYVDKDEIDGVTLPDNDRCLDQIGSEGIELFLDQAGDSMVAMDSAFGLDGNCPPVWQFLKEHHERNPQTRWCNASCPFGQHRRNVCVSANFAIVHKVKDPEHYQLMTKHFS